MVVIGVASFAIIFARAISEVLTEDLSTRYRRLAISVSVGVAVLIGIILLVAGEFVTAMYLPVVVFALLLMTFTRARTERQRNLERLQRVVDEHPELESAFQNHWLFKRQMKKIEKAARTEDRTEALRNGGRYLHMMNVALEHLAAPPSMQRAHLEKLGTAPSVDDLVLEFDDVVVLVPHMVDASLLTNGQATAIQDVDSKLKTMSKTKNPDLWRIDALDHSREWEEVRELARRALDELR